MSPRLAFTLPVLLAIPAAAYALRHVRIIQLESLRERIIWTFHSWRANYPVPLDIDQWQLNTAKEYQNELWKQVPDLKRPWEFLESFFAARGYTLYRPSPSNVWAFYPPPKTDATKPHWEPQFPYARRIYNEDRDIVFSYSSPRVWAARDIQGRDVVIRMISGRESSDELKIFQRLNTPEVRADPRNHSIYALDYINFDGLIFVVMPRWNEAFHHCDFHNVREIMHFMECLLEGVDFLHEHRIAHCDLLEPNTGVNVLAPMHILYLKGICDPAVAKYAIYDFGQSVIYPYNTVLEDVTVTKFLHFDLRGCPTPPGPHNPFHFDVLCLGVMLQNRVRHIEDIVPDIGPFFDSMITDDTTKRFTARQALHEFREIYLRLSPSQLDSLVTGRLWLDGHVKTKLDLPTRVWTPPPECT
ncbi:hypothetical protein BDQ12DRAFT_715773 [Crucibulum laeve]|uniref:Protein kinase domain-containing protein n=1 Tax=Crucibulum laeve TaxID=68775 RepID=A0A5C3LLC8_9AGAR|nr:hypothetical protein BDQ12DRAFT_715773 [Crucibulum laeve]